MIPNLSIRGIGLYLPPVHDIRELAISRGADPTGYNSWDRVCVATDDDDHPSTMAARALEQAFAQSGVPREDIRLVLSCGVSRDYPPSWSVSTEVIRLAGLSDQCLGLDITLGCAGALAGLDFVQGWLAARGGGYAAIVCGERWSYTVDFADPRSRTWAWSDNGGAMVVGMGDDQPAIAEFIGAEWTNRADYNGHVLIEYGGTRAPVAPAGVSPFTRIVSDRDRSDILATYSRGYRASHDALVARLGMRAHQLICNQTSPSNVAMMADGLGIAPEKVLMTGHDVGHLGSTDVMLGLSKLADQQRLSEPTFLGSSTAYAFGVGMVVPSTGGAR